MLEKIGLPPKPSMRGANWVIDASHCQGCSSQFTFFNRKHHCRRCGGIFCNSCTQQRMVLRGQGDSPVRICDPCKKLEEAARFEQRYGHKNRTTKGNSRQTLKSEDELLGEISGTSGQHLTSSRKELHMFSDSQGSKRSASQASSSVVSDNSGREGDQSNSIEGHNDVLIDSECTSPEDLRQQSMEEKKRYRTLKAEGKTEEALKAFKHGKELERQAGALEIAIRKNRRAAGKASNISSRVSMDSMDDNEALGSEKKVTSLRNKEVKDDLFTELRQLGWSDAELNDADKKPAKLSLEGELSTLLGESFQKSDIGKKKSGVDNTQVVAHKRKALLLKREGKLAEAKEELKQAKILEKQLEEQELLGDDSDSEDELYTLIQNMDNEKRDDLMLKNDFDIGANFEHFLSATDDPTMDGNLEVTEDDMNDPEIGDTLRSFGWSEEDDHHEQIDASESVPLNQEALQVKILDLKKEALSQKRAGNVSEATALLKKAKLLEQDLGTIQSSAHTPEPGFSQKAYDNQINAPKSKMVIQKELLVLKKKALTLRREGRLEEADAELKKGKVLEQQLEELENTSKKPVTIPGPKRMESTHTQDSDIGTFDVGLDSAETDVTEQDMHDPTMLSVLKNLGWIDDESVLLSGTHLTSKPSNSYSVHESAPAAISSKSMRNKAEVQRELLAIKRKALSLRRQGKTEEAEEELERAKDLEKLLADLESHISGSLVQQEAHNGGNDNSSRILDVETNKIVDIAKLLETHSVLVSAPSPETYGSKVEIAKGTVPVLPETDQNIGLSNKQYINNSKIVPHKSEYFNSITNKTNGINTCKEEILVHKRNAVALKREGKLMEAKEELRKAKFLEKSLEESQESSIDDQPAPVSTFGSTSTVQENTRAHLQKPTSTRDRFKLQQESLAHKRNALKLRREGKMQEAEAEFEKAKELESQLEELGAQASSSTAVGTDAVEDLLDPQLMSALKSIGWDDKDLLSKTSEKPTSKSVKEKSSDQSQLDKTHLEEQIKATKLRALNLKRAGRQDEALEALRSAKKLEKKLDSMA